MSIQEEDEPLDPTLERVRRKMLRLMIISIGIMMIGLMAVLFAIVYKISSPTVTNDGKPVNIELSDGAEILSTSVNGENLLVDTKLPNGHRELIILNAQSGAVKTRVIVKTK